MAKGGAGSGMIWATAEDLARNRPLVLSLYRQILRALNSPELPLGHATRLAKKAECRAIFLFGAEERSLHNIRDLVETLRLRATRSDSSTAAASYSERTEERRVSRA